MAERLTRAARAEGDADRPIGLRERRGVVLFLGVALGVTIAVIVAPLVVQAASDGDRVLLVGAVDSDPIVGVGVWIGLSALAIALCVVPVRRWWLVLLVPARLVALAAAGVAALATLVQADVAVTPIMSGGCATGYVVQERSFLLAGSGTVLRVDGVLATPVETTIGDDGYKPFLDGAYALRAEGGRWAVWYRLQGDPSAGPVPPVGEPAFTLPMLSGERECAAAAGPAPSSPAPPPPSDTPEPATPDALRDAVAERLAASVAAAAGPVMDEAGVPLDPATVPPTAVTCDIGGTRFEVGVTMRTADNAASLARILADWDAAGYRADRAIQEDLRYSETLPVERMSIRDSTTIDGALHLSITSRCSTSA